jgi:hypothetical protein
MVAHHWKKGDTKDFRHLKKALPLLFPAIGDHVSEMDDKVRFVTDDVSYQSRVSLCSVLTVSEHSKMVRGVKGFGLFDTLADLSDGLGLNIERKDEKESTEGQSVKCPLPAHHSLEIPHQFHLQILP